MESSLMSVGLAGNPSIKQRVFLRYFTAVLIDLVILNLFAEYLHWVVIESFTVSLAAALLMQLILKLSLQIEHRVAAFFTGRRGKIAVALRYISGWVIIFASKLLMLEAVSIVAGDKMSFGGPLHGVAVFIALVLAMLVAEALVVLFYRRLS